MFGPFGDQRIAVGVGQVFGQASENIRERRARSMERELVGNRAREEPSDTDDLIDNFDTAVTSALRQSREQLLASGIQMDIEFYPTNFPRGEEDLYGPDLGVRFHIETPDFNVTKAILFQNKRAYGTADKLTFNQLRGDGELQARKMLNVTPASFFLLFNGLPVSTVGDWIKPPVSLWPYFEEDWPGPWRWAERYAQPFTLWNTGVLVLPASRVYAESRVLNGKPLDIDARHWIRASLPLGLFMVDMIGSCFVGDVRDDVIQLVTPPKLRDLPGPIAGDIDSSMHSVRRLMDISIRVDGKAVKSSSVRA